MKKIGDITNTADKNGEFTDGNVAAGIPPTQLMAGWFNSVQREILNVLSEAGILQSADNDEQLKDAIIKIIANADYMPSGESYTKKESDEKFTTKIYLSEQLGLKLDTSSVVQTTGTSKNQVMSHKSVSDELANKINISRISENKYSTTKGELIRVADYGLGVADGSVMILSDIFDIKSSGKYVANGAEYINPTKNMPSSSGNYVFVVEVSNVRNGTFTIQLLSLNQTFTGYIDTNNKTIFWNEAVKQKDIESVKNTLLGVNQSWQELTSARALNTTYSNSTSKPISVNAVIGGASVYCYFIVDDIHVGYGHSPANPTTAGAFAIVPPGGRYRLFASGSGTQTLNYWSELR